MTINIRKSHCLDVIWYFKDQVLASQFSGLMSYTQDSDEYEADAQNNSIHHIKYLKSTK